MTFEQRLERGKEIIEQILGRVAFQSEVSTNAKARASLLFKQSKGVIWLKQNEQERESHRRRNER